MQRPENRRVARRCREPQPARGWRRRALYVWKKSASHNPNIFLDQLHAMCYYILQVILRSFLIVANPPPLPDPLVSVGNKELISPLESALTDFFARNFFRIRTYKKQGGGVMLSRFSTILYSFGQIR